MKTHSVYRIECIRADVAYSKLSSYICTCHCLFVRLRIYRKDISLHWILLGLKRKESLKRCSKGADGGRNSVFVLYL